MKLGDLIWAECLRVILKHNLKISKLSYLEKAAILSAKVS